MQKFLVVGSSLLFVFACSKDAEKSEPSAQPTEEVGKTAPEPEAKPGEEALAKAKQGAKGLGMALKKRLTAAMSEGGPPVALHVCADEASVITEQAGTTNLRVGRSSLRLRNSKNADAPAWVKEWLVKAGDGSAEGIAGVEEVVDGTARVLMPLTVAEVCTTCHGAKESLQAEVVAKLDEHYPDDKAVDYKVGDLRGALWAELKFE